MTIIATIYMYIYTRHILSQIFRALAPSPSNGPCHWPRKGSLRSDHRIVSVTSSAALDAQLDLADLTWEKRRWQGIPPKKCGRISHRNGDFTQQNGDLSHSDDDVTGGSGDFTSRNDDFTSRNGNFSTAKMMIWPTDTWEILIVLVNFRFCPNQSSEEIVNWSTY